MALVLRILDKLAQAVLYAFAVLVITLAVITSLLRYYLPQMDLYRADLLAFASKQTQWQINAESITAKWQQFRPTIELRHLNLSHADTGHRINLDYLQLELNIAKSLYRQKPYLETIILDGLEVVLLQDEHGQWGFSSTSDAKRTLSVEEVADYIWSVGSFRLHDLSLTMLPYRKQAIHFPQASASLSSRLSNKILQIDIDEGAQNRSHLVVETINHFRDKQFQAEIYWRTEDFPLHVFFPLIKDVRAQDESRITQELWFSWQNGLPSGTGEFSLDGLAVEYQGKPWVAESGQGSFYLDSSEHLLSLGVPSLSFTLNDQLIQFNKLKYEQRDDHREIQIERLNLAEIDNYLSFFTLPERLQQLREDLQPSGEVTHISLELKENDILLKANLHEVYVGAWAGAPALENVSGYVEASLFEGFVELDTPKFNMAFPKLYDGKMQFQQSKGTVYWNVGETVQVGSVGQISLDGLYGQAIGEFELAIPLGADPEDAVNVGRISLLVDLHNADARFRNELIPSILDDGLLDWLDEGILGGQVKHGSFIYHGPIVAHGEEQKVIQLWLDAEQTAIRFHSDLAPVENISGEFLLDQLNADAELRSAKSLGMNLNNSKVSFSIGGNSPYIHVSTELREKSQKVLKYLQQDFIKQASGGMLENWQTNHGEVEAKVDVMVPLKLIKDTQINVQAKLDNINLEVVQARLLLKEVVGGLEYDTSKGISAEKIEGKLWGERVSAKVIATERGGQLQFHYPKASMERIKNWLDFPLLEFFTGEMALQGELNWGGGNVDLNLLSTLVGVTADLPSPFFKQAEEERRLELFLPLRDGETDLILTVDDLHQMQLRLADGQLVAGNIMLNQKELRDLTSGELNVYGLLESVNVARWVSTIEKFIDFSLAKPKSQSSVKLAVKELEIEAIDIWSIPLQKIQLSIQEEKQHWQFKFLADHFDGQLAIPFDNAFMQLQFKTLDLALLQDLSLEQEDQRKERAGVNFQPIQVSIDRLMFGEQFFGQWQLTVEAEHDSVLFNHIDALVREMHLSSVSEDTPCQLAWSLGKNEQTKVNCRIQTSKIDQSLKEWGLEQGVFAEEFEAVIHDAIWQGSPADFDMLTSRVPLSLSLNKGYFADLDSASTDALKALGFFNLSNLVRRLKLDFKDLSQEGLTFDKAKGRLILDQGIVSSDDPFLIKGSASEIKISGLGDFNHEVLDLNMAVSLPLVSNLPWIIALAAGLPAAVGVFVVSKIMGKQVDKLSTAVYHISGSMAEPKVKFKRLFDVEKEQKKSKKSE